LWEVSAGKKLKVWRGDGAPGLGAVFSRDGREIAGWGGGYQIQAWHAVTGSDTRIFDKGKSRARPFALSRDNSRLAYISDDSAICNPHV